jgi:hypothetical protein
MYYGPICQINLFECDRPVFVSDIQITSGVSSEIKVKLNICFIYLTLVFLLQY